MKPSHAAALALPARSALLEVPIIYVLMIVCLCGCRFFPEAEFELAPESRLPRWFTLPKGLSRTDVTVTMDSYIGPMGRSSAFWLLDKKGNTLAKVNSVMEGEEPHVFGNGKKNKYGGYVNPLEAYPAYEIETANGITEVIEHKQMEPVFYISDDPEVRRRLGLIAGSNNPPKSADRSLPRTPFRSPSAP
jgi:hypothetical protein